jgi:hypothetical protein
VSVREAVVDRINRNFFPLAAFILAVAHFNGVKACFAQVVQQRDDGG